MDVIKEYCSGFGKNIVLWLKNIYFPNKLDPTKSQPCQLMVPLDPTLKLGQSSILF